MGCLGSKSKKNTAKPANDTSTAKTKEEKANRTQQSNNTAEDKQQQAAQSSGNPQSGNKKEKTFENAIESDINDAYMLGDEIGRGGFSVVVEATSKKDGEKYAVKIIEKSMIQDDIKLLRREIEIMKKVSHPNILKLHEIYETDEKVYIVMELVQGSELFDRIVDKGYYSEKNAINIVKQILSAVAYLHSKGIAHRDLKPENLLCSGTGDNEIVKIADFGLSKIFNDNEELMTSCGTPGYVAPEVLMCESYDKSVDMWGIGIITYILLAGYPPFYAENDTALFEKIMNAEYDFDDECWEDVSDLAKDFIRHLLVKDPKERYTAEEALKHPWLSSDASDKQLKIGRKMSEYNMKRKEQKQKYSKDDSVAALNAARQRVKEKKAAN
jgi:serine/threonine protein kinase